MKARATKTITRLRSYGASLLLAMFLGTVYAAPQTASWHGTIRDSRGDAVPGAQVELRAVEGDRVVDATADSNGAFAFNAITAGSYHVSVHWQQEALRSEPPLEIRAGESVAMWLDISPDGRRLLLRAKGHSGSSPAAGGTGLNEAAAAGPHGSGGERLSSKEVSSLPLNQRDFSQLLLLAGGTQTDTNGSSNFTQQFAVNGQRGTTAVFAMDGIFISDPEMGGATFPNFNVEAIQEIRSNSGVMPAEIGAGAASYTDVITKSGTSAVHGAVFSFVRNAAFDARNFFDRRSLAQPERIPPFARNEFGFTNGGPMVLPGLYDGRGRTFYFGQYQGFRQVLGTTQVFPVPTLAERQGFDSSAYPGDTLLVPVNPQVAQVLARYPLPDDPQGAYGARTYAISSKVVTNSNQFSIRIDHRISDQAQFFARFNFNNLTGPTTNPAQTALDPSFGVTFFNHQRNLGLRYTRSVSPKMTSESSFGFIRTTPTYPPLNLTQPGMNFADGLYESFNSTAGSLMAAFGNLFQARQNFTYVDGKHTFKWGAEARINRDTTLFGISPNGAYTFGGGPSYALEDIPSLSGAHDVHIGDQLPDTLTSFLTGAPHSYTTSVAPPMFAQGSHIGEVAVRREAYNFYFQDAWKISPRLMFNYGLRYEVTTRLHAGHKLTAGSIFVGPGGSSARSWDSDAQLKFLVNPQPPYSFDWHGWGPRLSLDWNATDRTVLHAGGAITTVLMNPWMDNFMTGGTPFVVTPLVIAMPGTPVPFENKVTPLKIPVMLTPEGQPVFTPGQPTDNVAPNTELDVVRLAEDLAAEAPGQPFRPYPLVGMAQDFRNGYIQTYTAGLEHEFGDLKFSASYVGTAGVKLADMINVNGYGGAIAGFAPFTRFDATGQAVGGVGPVTLMSTRSHSTFHSFQAGLAKTSPRAGLGFQANYTWSKSLDDSSTPSPGFFASGSNAILQTPPQDPRNPGAEKGPSIFDITHAVSLSLIQELPFDRVGFLRPLGRKVTSGWQFLNITTLASGLPFSVYSGVQQTGIGVNSADRPDQVGRPVFSTGRKIREDYFGLGDANPSFFSIPIHLPEGTGPNQGRFGTLGRDTFRGPGLHNFDLALTKDMELAHRSGGEPIALQFRAEFFNGFNLVNFGLPSNVVVGSGFGIISQTAGPSRQIQVSLKLFY
ncbi:MAG: carboxypeptidase-like regulatory domain-containing protein [Terriglobia bacterium]